MYNLFISKPILLQYLKKWNFICKNIKDIPSENFKIKFFYKVKNSKKLVLNLKFNSEHVKNNLKLV